MQCAIEGMPREAGGAAKAHRRTAGSRACAAVFCACGTMVSRCAPRSVRLVPERCSIRGIVKSRQRASIVRTRRAATTGRKRFFWEAQLTERRRRRQSCITRSLPSIPGPRGGRRQNTRPTVVLPFFYPPPFHHPPRAAVSHRLRRCADNRVVPVVVLPGRRDGRLASWRAWFIVSCGVTGPRPIRNRQKADLGGRLRIVVT